MSTPQFFFSTGTIYVGDVGDTLDDTNIVGAVQSATFDPKFEVKEVREAATINLWPVAVAMFDASGTLQIEIADFSEALIAYCTGAVKSTGGGNNVYTATTTSKPAFVQIKLVGELIDGRAATLEIGRSRAPGLPLGFKRDDFVMPSAEFRIYPIDNDATPWKLTIATS